MLEDQVLPTFVNRTADEIIWGYDDPLTKMGREFSEGLKSDQFGLMAGTNYTFYGRFRQSYRYQVLTINSNVIGLAQEMEFLLNLQLLLVYVAKRPNIYRQVHLCPK